jgi:mRNA-degrading endonuclease RelE of RelBE toxin-antitoxin system
MKLLATSKFNKLRKRNKTKSEITALGEAIKRIVENPAAGKPLKGEFRGLRSYRYSVKGQSRRLVYKTEEDAIIFFSFGPREGIYK